ncbi:MAG: preprotein translocase subunit SecE [Deltaproteobacteria bacterium]|nr:preprotein translocase subunit SecE [Deltaproteobacteria bacterium]
MLSLPDPALIGSGFTATTLVGLLGAGAAVFLSLRSRRVRTYSDEVVAELVKVSWPDRQETKRSTVVVIVTSLVLAAMMGVFDEVWGTITGLIYS